MKISRRRDKRTNSSGFTMVELLAAFALSLISLGLTVFVIINSLNMYTKDMSRLFNDFSMNMVNSTLLQKINRASYISITDNGYGIDLFDYNKIKTGSFNKSGDDIIFTDNTEDPPSQKTFEDVAAAFSDPNGTRGIHIRKVRIDYQLPFKALVIAATDTGYMGCKACNLNSLGGIGDGSAEGSASESWAVLISKVNKYEGYNNYGKTVIQSVNAQGKPDYYVVGGGTVKFADYPNEYQWFISLVSNKGEWLWKQSFDFDLDSGTQKTGEVRSLIQSFNPSTHAPDGFLLAGTITDVSAPGTGLMEAVGLVIKIGYNSGYEMMPTLWAKLLRTTITANSCVQVSDGSYVIAAIPMPLYPVPPEYKFGINLMKLNRTTGNVIWSKVNQIIIKDELGVDHEIGNASVECLRETFDQSGNSTGFIACGYSKNLEGDNCTYIARLNTNGGIVWHKIYEAGFYGTGIRQVFNSLHQPDGYIASACGRLLLRINETGGILWAKKFTGAATQGFFSINDVRDGSGDLTGYIIGGITNIPSTADPPDNAYSLLVDKNGNYIWSRYYGGWLGDDIKCAIQSFNSEGAPDGYILAGRTQSFCVGKTKDMFLIKTDSSGNCQMAKQCPIRLAHWGLGGGSAKMQILGSAEYKVTAALASPVIINYDEIVPVYPTTISSNPT